MQIPYTALLLALLGLASASQASDSQWRDVDASKLIYIDTPDGRVVVELNDRFAEQTVAHFKQLVQDGFYDGLTFYRVIDGFVAQAGDGSDISDEIGAEREPLIAEFERPWNADWPWMPVQAPDMFAAETGFMDGFPVARDGDASWLVHCPGTFAMARGNAADSGYSDFYIVIGQAPRYLDRNLTVFGRVIDGMAVVQQVLRGPVDKGGVIESPSQRTAISQVKLASDLLDEERIDYQVINTHHADFEKMLHDRRERANEWFLFKPPPVLDVCQVPVAVRRKP
ncbi:MAG: peptidyl-prolyl cis-trans isomerase [Lysobacteraceae bacterium]|nr:MAG: peptidyl-prolyl cis-trans isomerase [Xanthomonadaceae bacterium]